MNDLSLALIRKGKGTGVVAGTTSRDLELALAKKYGNEAIPVPTTYLTFSAPAYFELGTQSGKSWNGTLIYSFDGTTWTKWNGEFIESQNVGGQYQVLLSGYRNTYITNGDSFSINGSDISCSGDIRALLDFEKAAANEDPPMASRCFADMFYGCNIISPPDLPSMTLSPYYYAGMFNFAPLQTAPALPATTLAADCYERMFNGCAALTTAPTLPATTLAENCYAGMFASCTSLASAPTLPATTLAAACYASMFEYCSALTSAPALPATTLADRCYFNMFYNCTNLASIPELPATSLTDACYLFMFASASALKISTTSTAECPNAYRIPTTGTGTSGADSLLNMFSGTGGSFIGTPSIDTTYYTNATIVPAA